LFICCVHFGLHIAAQESDILNQHFSTYSVGHVEQVEVHPTSQNNYIWRLSFGTFENQSATLFENQLIGAGHIVSTDHDASILDQNMIKTYSGYLNDDPSSSIRITSYQGQLSGYINSASGKFFIEPTERLTGIKDGQHVIYHEKDVIDTIHGTCAASQAQRRKSNFKPTESSSAKSSGCRTYEIAIAVDHSYYLDHGGTSGAIAQSTSVMNMVAGDYDDAFSEEIRFEIVEHWVSTCSSCDPWTSSADAENLLNSFTSWGPNGFNNSHDLGQLWTNRDIFFRDSNGTPFFSTVGLAWLGVVCGSFRYHILEDFTNTNWALRVLVTHEMGHNFDSDHDAPGTSFIMSPSINNTTTWSTASRTMINSAIQNYNCFSGCTSANCNQTVTLRNPVTENNIEAGQLINTSGSIQISQNTTLSAPNIQLENISVLQGASLTLDEGGCN